MAEYRGSIGGNSVLPAKDVVIADGETLAKGDLVTLDANGKATKSVAASTSIVGVSEGGNPQTEYEKANGIQVAKVRFDKGQVIELPFTGGTPKVGVAYAINDAQQLDVAGAGSKLLKVVEVRTNTAKVVIA